jgi:hypothetical protein
MQDLHLEQDDDILTYGSAQELRHLVNGILGRVAVRDSTPIPETSHALLEALRLGYRLKFLIRKADTTINRLKATVDHLKGEVEHGPN